MSNRLNAHPPGPNAQEAIGRPSQPNADALSTNPTNTNWTGPQTNSKDDDTKEDPLIGTNAERKMDEALLDPNVDPDMFPMEKRMELMRKNSKNRVKGEQNPAQAQQTAGDPMLIRDHGKYNDSEAGLERLQHGIDMPSDRAIISSF